MKNHYRLIESKDAFKVLFEKLNNAKKSIHVETFTLRNDLIGRTLINILAEKSKTIPVVLIVDDRGLKTLGKKQELILKNSRIKFFVFNPKWAYLKKLQFGRILSNMIHMTHRKLTLIDDKFAFIGGINYNSNELKWVDFVVEIKGDIVLELKKSAKEMLGIVSRAKGEKRKLFNGLSKSFKLVNERDLVIRQVPYNNFNSTISKEVIRLIQRAKKEIIISTPYFVPPPGLLHLLRKLSKKGISISIIIPKTADRKDANIMNYYNAFITTSKSDISIYLSKKMTHAKYLIVDKSVCTFGSANLDFQTWISNYELNIMTKNRYFIKQLLLFWEKSLSYSEHFELIKHYGSRSNFNKLLEFILKYFKKFF